MKKLIMLAALIVAAPFAYAEGDMAKDAADAAATGAEAAADVATEAVEVVDKGTQAVTEQSELSQAKAADAAQ